MTSELLTYGQILVDDFFSNLNLDDIFLVVPTFEPELKPVIEEVELEVAKTVVVTMKQ